MGAEVGRRGARDAGAADVAGPLSERLCPRLQAAVGPVTAAPRQPRPGGLLSRRLRQRRLCRFAVSLFRFSILWFLLFSFFFFFFLSLFLSRQKCGSLLVNS